MHHIVRPLARLSTWAMVHMVQRASAAANYAGASGTADVVNGVAHAAGGVPATTWLADNFSGVSAGLCARVGTPIDANLTPRLDAQDDGQVAGDSSGLRGLPVSAVREAASAGLEDLSDDDDAAVDDVIGELFRGEFRPARDACDEDAGLAMGDDDQVGVSGSA